MIYSEELLTCLKARPNAVALVKGSEFYPGIKGRILFFNVKDGVMVRVEISGLPQKTDVCKSPVFALHIHSGNSCTGDYTDPFADAGVHFNPENCPHPYHAGDLPPLFGVNGKAVMCVLTNRFKLQEVIGKTVIIHSKPDDFTTQPSGNAGEKIACGVIKAY